MAQHLFLYALPGERFSVSREEKSLLAEHSDLGRVQLQQRLYDDACDVGIAIRGKGGVTVWYLHEEQCDREGDLEVTIYMPTSETLRKHPQLEGWTVHILND